MKPEEIRALVEGIVPTMKKFLVLSLEKRVAAIPPALPGRDGRDGLPGQKGEPGINGRDGVDGLGFDDFELAYDGERTFTFTWRSGERVKTYAHRAPFTIDRGVWRPSAPYQRGDAVTFGGCFWIAQKDDPAGKPGDADDWRLAVKKGRDGRDGEKGEKGERGLPGLDGRRLP